MKNLLTAIAIILFSPVFAQHKVKSIDIEVPYNNEIYLVTYVIDTAVHTSLGWPATVNVYKDGQSVFVGQKGIYEKNRRSTRPTKNEIEFIETALTLRQSH